ncbi:hypothetical protein ACSNOI_19540 [Actinomadura kijaniata]|uniref:hypothetical protein n=1 Tax=Actinomadura kijaniata TaxID=46161 RepID=UPI003F19BFC3
MSASTGGRPVGRTGSGGHPRLSCDNDDERPAMPRARVRGGPAAGHEIVSRPDRARPGPHRTPGAEIEEGPR